VITRFFASVGKHDGDTKAEVLTTSASGTHGEQEVLFLQSISRSEVEMALKQTKVWKATGLNGAHGWYSKRAGSWADCPMLGRSPR